MRGSQEARGAGTESGNVAPVSMPGVVHLVTSGEYSDYAVCAAFLNEADAEQACRDAPGRWPGRYVVEQRHLFDGLAVKAYRHEWWLLEHFENDASIGLVGSHGVPEPRYEQEIPEWELTRRVPVNVIIEDVRHPESRAPGAKYYRPVGIVLTVEGTDRERCAKVFSEKRAQLLAHPWLAMSEDDIAATLHDYVRRQPA